MRAVDASHVHARSDEVTHQRIVVSGLTRQGHHHPRNPALRPRTEQGVSVAIERGTSLFEGQRRRGQRRWLSAVERTPDALDRCQYVRFAPPQRRQAPLDQTTLQPANVAATQREVVDQVDGIAAVVGMYGRDVTGMRALQAVHTFFERCQIGADRRADDVTPRRIWMARRARGPDPDGSGRPLQRAGQPVAHHSGLSNDIITDRGHDRHRNDVRARRVGPKGTRGAFEVEHHVNELSIGARSQAARRLTTITLRSSEQLRRRNDS